jgi:hypothetical protein
MLATPKAKQRKMHTTPVLHTENSQDMFFKDIETRIVGELVQKVSPNKGANASDLGRSTIVRKYLLRKVQC